MNIEQTTMPDAVIANAASVSQTMDFGTDFFDAEAISIQAPSVFDAVTTTIQVSFDGVNFGDLQDLTGTAIKAPSTANAMMVYNGVLTAINFWRLKTSGNVAAERRFKLIKAWRGL